MSNKELWTKTNQELIVGEKKGNGIGLYRHCEEMTSALSNKHYSGQHEATEEDSNDGTLGEDKWSQKCERQGVSQVSQVKTQHRGT